MQIAIEDLRLDRLYVVYPGKQLYPLTDSITVTPLPELIQTLARS